MKGIVGKYKQMREKYSSLKLQFKVGRHQLSGETGAAAGDQPCTAQETIDKATEKWHLFSAFHSAFRAVQRLRSDTWAETVSPFKGTKVASQRQASPSADGTAMRRAAAKRPWAAEACISGSSSKEDKQDKVVDAQLLSLDLATTSGAGAGKTVKRSRMSARDMQLGSTVAVYRMEATLKSAELREQTGFKPMEASKISKKEMVEKMETMHHAIADKHIASAAEDRKVLKESMEVQKEALEERKRNKKAKLVSAELLEMMRLFVSTGETPTEARRLERKDVLGE